VSLSIETTSDNEYYVNFEIWQSQVRRTSFPADRDRLAYRKFNPGQAEIFPATVSLQV
jgi:hypothetical protein